MNPPEKCCEFGSVSDQFYLPVSRVRIEFPKILCYSNQCLFNRGENVSLLSNTSIELCQVNIDSHFAFMFGNYHHPCTPITWLLDLCDYSHILHSWNSSFILGKSGIGAVTMTGVVWSF